MESILVPSSNAMRFSHEPPPEMPLVAHKEIRTHKNRRDKNTMQHMLSIAIHTNMSINIAMAPPTPCKHGADPKNMERRETHRFQIQIRSKDESSPHQIHARAAESESA